MSDVLFYIFAALALICGVMILVSRNPVNSAMFLVLTIASLAGLFVLLEAFFLAAVQILVYAGAIMVLFLFIIMLLDLKVEDKRAPKMIPAAGGIAVVIAFVIQLIGILGQSADQAFPALGKEQLAEAAAKAPAGSKIASSLASG